MAKFTNRIIGYFEKPAKEFTFNPHNWRLHPPEQRRVLNASLKEFGWITGVIENKTTGNLIDGHARIQEVIERNPEELVPFLQVELSEEEEKQILLLFDPISSMADTDAEQVKALLEIVDTENVAFLDLFAKLSGESEINVIEIEKQETSLGVALDYLTFGKERVPLTEEELTALQQKYAEHIQNTGVNNGFIASLFDL